MIRKDIMDIIYETIKEKEIITTKEFYALGLSSFDINCLIEEDKIIRLKPGKYYLTTDSFYKLGLNFFNNNDSINSEYCFVKCCEMDKNYVEKIYKLFCDNIVNKDYNNVVFFFKILNKFSNIHTLDINTIMFLLNQIVDLSDEIKNDFINNIIDENNKGIIGDFIKENIIKNNFVKAYSLLINNNSYEDNLIKDILKEIIIKKTNENNKLLDLVRNKKYKEVITILNNKSNNSKLSMFEEYVIDLINVYNEINETQKIPKKEDGETNNMLQAINNSDYFNALDLCEKYNKSKNIGNNDNLIYLLLKDICFLIDKISSFSDTIINLVNNNIETAIDKLKLFLNYKNKDELEELLLNSIKLDIYEKDKAFIKTINVLIDIDNNRFILNLNDYIDNFYNCINKNDLKKAELYLNIILNYSNNKELNDSILNVFNSSINIIIYRKSNNQENNFKYNSNDYIKYYNYEEFLDNKHYELLSNKGIIIIRGLDETKANELMELSKKYKDMYMLYFKEDKDIKLVLKYKSVKNKNINVEELLNNSNNYFKENKYMLSLNNLLDIIKYSNCNYVIYFKLALLYLKICKYDLARDYFDVSLSLCNDIEQQMNISYLIDKNNNKENIEIDFNLFTSEDEFVSKNILGNVKKRKK